MRGPRVHGDMLTVSLRGPLAEKTREMAESHQMSLAKLLGDMVLIYGRQVDAGYEPGRSVTHWTAQ